jgi:hypothetical protein
MILNIFLFSYFIVNLTISFAQDLVISPSPLYLGKIPIGSISEREIIIFNTSVSSININSISISGSGASKFTVLDNPNSFSLNPIQKKEFLIQYQPSDPLNDIAILNVVSSAGSFTDTLQGYGIPPSGNVQAFERILGTSEDDHGSQITQTKDGGFIITGTTILPEDNYSSIYLMKVNFNGEVEWTSTYGRDNGPDNGNDIEQTPDGGYLVLGSTDNWGAGGTDMILVKFNSSGEYQWRKTYGSENNDGGSAMLPTQDGGYALVGQTLPSSGIGKTIYLVKVNADGIEQWSNTFGGSSGTDASDIIQLSDGNFLISGFVTINNDFQVYVVKASNTGNLIWEKNYGGSEFDYGYSIIELADGNLMVSGYTASIGAGARDGYLIKININGDLIWEKAFGFDRSDEFRRMVETNNGDIIVVGNSVTRVTSTEQYTDGYMVKTDSEGNLIWTNLYGGNLNDGFSSIIKTNDGGFITVGNTLSYSKSSDIYLVKTGESGIVSDVEKFDNTIIPNKIELSQNFPNPFNPSTMIQFSVAKADFIQLRVFDLLGNEVNTLIKENKQPGIYQVTFDASNLSSGIYFYQLVASNKNITKKMILIK